jgi:hypothetical protein
MSVNAINAEFEVTVEAQNFRYQDKFIVLKVTTFVILHPNRRTVFGGWSVLRHKQNVGKSGSIYMIVPCWYESRSLIRGLCVDLANSGSLSPSSPQRTDDVEWRG